MKPTYHGLRTDIIRRRKRFSYPPLLKTSLLGVIPSLGSFFAEGRLIDKKIN
jgi:hypothetical protein